ncbi:uncharacterized protein LOC133931270 [Phragmites australis]|uniref:uncharacterized protein LOC133931270 n=1 Tax=Phragmites australis TaxID=29695 RepID=UPI002D78E7C0|nr:uncharacterized protein LOC133931270 [Phragmites australis]
MGNCLNKASKQQRRRGDVMPEEEAESLSEMRRVSQAPAAEGLKVKIVLTRGELECLMAQLKSGEQSLEDVLHHVRDIKDTAAPRAGDGGWRPRLESILECPETACSGLG